MPIVRQGQGFKRVARPIRRARRGMGDDTETLSFPYVDGSTPIATPAPSSGSNQWVDILKASLPSGFLLAQEALAQPGQTIKTPTTLITGAGTNLVGLGTGGLSTGTWLVVGVAAVLGLALFAAKK